MSEEAIGEVSADYPGLQLHAPDVGESEWSLVAAKGNTRIRMKLGLDGLSGYRISWVDSIKHVTLLPEVDVCNSRAREASTSPSH